MDKLKMHSPDLTADKIRQIAELLPNCVTESRGEDGAVRQAIDFDQLRQELSDHLIVDGPAERYRLDWPGKREAILTANAPIAKTLRPCREESVDFGTTKNLFIEGDNLDALKLLQETYLGKVKLIYIDPPYNTGNDFLYEDDFGMSSANYLALSNQVSELNERLTTNPQSNGRFHSDWLSMIYPRLRHARSLLKDDGFIVVSIDDVELPRLREVMDEVFGNGNFLAVLVFDRNRKNDARFFSVGHEYMVVYAKSKVFLKDADIKLRAPKQGVDEVRALFKELRAQFGEAWESIKIGLDEYYKTIPDDDPRRPLARFTKVDERGPYRDDGNINWPGGNGPRYEVLHPKTGKPSKLPVSGWRYPTAERFWEEYARGRITFGVDEKTVPSIRTNLFDSDTQVIPSVRYSYAQTSANQFAELFDGARVFDNPKPLNDLKELVGYLTEPDDCVMDFFAGSGTLGHAVIEQNAFDKGKRKFIVVQIPASLSPDNEGEKTAANFLATISRPLNIAEITKERLRRGGSKAKSESPFSNLDTGFRVLKIDTSNMQDVYYTPDETQQQSLLDHVDNIKPERTPEDLLFQVLLDWGVDLASPIASETVDGKRVFFVDGNALAACFDFGLTDEFVKQIAERKPLRAVFRDASYSSDAAKINVEQIFKFYSPETEVRCL